MTKPERDPREAVLERVIRAAWTCGVHGDDIDERPPVPRVADVLARLDAADPIRQVWPEVVGALEEATTSLETVARLGGKDEYLADMSQVRQYAQNRASVARAALAKAREIEEPTDES